MRQHSMVNCGREVKFDTRVTISEKGQISIPVSLRRWYGWKKGERLVVKEADGAIVLRPLPRHPCWSSGTA